ncbi:MAG: hypothetical protein KC425_13090 [Anaerolineales bacterium]|nr:hypothetical protein [Anaerolineales bacterium]
MLVKEQIARELDELDEVELQQVADFVAFLRFRAQLAYRSPTISEEVGRLYAEFAEEDRILAEQGMSDYEINLNQEETL